MARSEQSASVPLLEARARRESMVPRLALADPIAEKWEAVIETVRWIVADDELADRLLVALANLAPASIEVTR